MDAFEVILMPGADPIDLVAHGSLEDDIFYTVENTGGFRAELWPQASMPDRNTQDGFKLLPRGIMAVRTIQPKEQGPIWVWASESVRTKLKVAEAPQ